MSGRTTILACPTCGAALTESPTQYACGNGHRFDRARTGYVNLLPTARRRSSGDSQDMLQARRRFLSRGHYDAVVDWLSRSTRTAMAGGSGAVLDAGCGEGHYLRRLAAGLGGMAGYGVDISKAAVRMASAADRSGRTAYAVANTYRLPVLASSVDVLVKVFSPIGDEEASRVLRGGGIVAEVIPGPDHLRELRAVLYREDRPHDDASSLGRSPRFAVSDETRIHRQLRAQDVGQVADLLAMSPYRFAGGPEPTTLPDTVTIDFTCRLLVPTGP